MADRIRMQTLALSTTALGQGVSFWHAGGDLLRSKSLDRNSYDSGDWFNVLDFSYRPTASAAGCRRGRTTRAKWAYMKPLLADPALEPERRPTSGRPGGRPTRCCRSGRARRCSTSAPSSWCSRRCRSPAAGRTRRPGVIVMRIDDTVGRDVDPRLKGLVVVFNATPEPTTQTVAGTAGQRFGLHPVQANGADPVVKGSAYDRQTGTFTVPARTVAVFVQR